MAEKQPSGFQFELADGSEMIKEWECPICLMIIKDVVELPCSHIYCDVCLVYHEGKICPKEERSKRKPKFTCSLCSKEYLISQKRPVKSTDRMIQTSIQIKCKQSDNGCQWKGCIMDYEAHCKKCPYIVVECPNEDCHDKVRRKDICEHSLICDFRHVPCQYCDMQLPFINIEEHNEICDSYPVTCANEGCQQIIPRNQVDLHCQNDCLHQVIDCDFHQAGCKTKAKRIDIDEHNKSSTQQHMMMLLGMNLQLKTQLENSNQRIEALEESVQQKNQQIKELESFAVGIVTIQKRLIKETLKEPQVELLEEDRWKADKCELKWRKFLNQHIRNTTHDNEFSQLLKQNVFDIHQETYWSSFNNTLKRMTPNKYYYGSEGEFYKVNVPSYIDSLQVVYTSSLSRYWTKDPTMGLKSSNYLVSYSEGNYLHIVIRDEKCLGSSYLVHENKWKEKIELKRNETLVKNDFFKFVVDNFVMVYCELLELI